MAMSTEHKQTIWESVCSTFFVGSIYNPFKLISPISSQVHQAGGTKIVDHEKNAVLGFSIRVSHIMRNPVFAICEQ